jgi:hypothetical protein
MKSKCVIFVLLLCGCTQMSIKPQIQAKMNPNRDFNSKSAVYIDGFKPNINFQSENLEVLNAKDYDIIVYEER